MCKKITVGDQLSQHFNIEEFRCSCGCGSVVVSELLINRLEKFFDIIPNIGAVIISSGYRCPAHSVAVGGFSDDTHTLGIGADIKVRLNDNTFLPSYDIAEVAEKIGFGGIGLMSNCCCHVDTRETEKYKNAHWFGDETTGNDNILTFNHGYIKSVADYTKPNKRRIVLTVDDIEIYKGDI